MKLNKYLRVWVLLIIAKRYRHIALRHLGQQGLRCRYLLTADLTT